MGTESATYSTGDVNGAASYGMGEGARQWRSEKPLRPEVAEPESRGSNKHEKESHD